MAKELKELKAAVAKRRIAKFRPGWEPLDLKEFSSITEEAAELVSQVERGEVDLRNLEEISEKVAEHLGNHKGSLDLGGLKSLSVGSATSLAGHDGWLHMGIEELDDDAALALSKGTVTLNLTGLKSLNATPGHIALAGKLVADDTADRMYSLQNVAKEIIDKFPSLKQSD
jgi:hypothetical protein